MNVFTKLLMLLLSSISFTDSCQVMIVKNLSEVEEYLHSTVEQDQVIAINTNGLYYKTLQKGIGSKQVNEDDCPSLTIDIYELDSFGKEKFSFSIGPGKKIQLATAIDAIRKGVKGMVVGEKRRIFAHPDFTHGEIGFLAPEHYVIFDVEVISN